MISYQTAAPGAPLVEVESVTPVPQGAEVLIKTLACGVCHSDIHMHDGMFELGGGKQLEVGREGMVLGHEIFGEVIAKGPEAEDISIGDRRVVFPWIGCGECSFCKRGEEHICTPGRALGIMSAGGFSDHVLVPHSRYLFDKGDVTRTFNSSDAQTAKAIRKSTGGVYAALDFVGAEASVNYGLSCLRKGGMLIIIGLYGGALSMPIPFIPMNARIIQGSYVGSLQDMSDLMAMVRDGKIAPIEITERPLAEANEALIDLKAGKVKGRQVLVSG